MVSKFCSQGVDMCVVLFTPGQQQVACASVVLLVVCFSRTSTASRVPCVCRMPIVPACLCLDHPTGCPNG